MTTFEDYSPDTDQTLAFVIEWIAEYRTTTPPKLLLAPDYLFGPHPNHGRSRRDIKAFIQRCRILFPADDIVSALNTIGPPPPQTAVALIAHEDWKFSENNFADHYFLLKIDQDEPLQTVFRQLIVLKFAFAMYRGDCTKLSWLFDTANEEGLAPLKFLKDDMAFDNTIDTVLWEWEDSPFNVDDNQKIGGEGMRTHVRICL